jgi:hypothetical protein
MWIREIKASHHLLFLSNTLKKTELFQEISGLKANKQKGQKRHPLSEKIIQLSIL